MKLLFAFENRLPSTQADAEVFVTTARHLAPLTAGSWLHVPLPRGADPAAAAPATGLTVVRAVAPARPAALRHLCCGLSLVAGAPFRRADAVYTRNLWIAWIALLCGQRVVFDHYRPWPDQIPPLQPWIRRLMGHRRFLLNICHSEYTRAKYLALGVAPDKLVCVHNGFAPGRLSPPMTIQDAKCSLGLPPEVKTVIYTGRLNHKKGLALVIAAARRLPDLLFVLVGSSGHGVIETAAAGIANLRIVAWQQPDALKAYIFAADVLLIPPSWAPLAQFGSTVLPLKLFLYMASGRPILAGDTPDIRELLADQVNALLCRPDSLDALVAGLTRLTQDAALACRLGAAASAHSAGLTWQARARRIAELLAAKLATAPAPAPRWTAAQYRAWLGHSHRWLVHLLRTRSWVLPPQTPPPAATGLADAGAPNG